MRTLATILLLLGVADLVAINAVIGPAALAEDEDPGAEGTRGHGHERAAATERVAVPAPSPRPVERAEPDLPPPRPLTVAASPDPVPVPAADVRPRVASREHPDSLPRRVTIHFDLDSAELGRSATAALDRVAADLEVRVDLTLEVSGHADESGSEEYNQSLSERRAQAVVDDLQERGVDATRLAVHAFGELKPVDTDRSRTRKNRRVELRFVSPNATGDPR